MRNYILTAKERKTLKAFIESGLELNGYSVLMLRLKRAHKVLKDDLALIDKAFQRVDK